MIYQGKYETLNFHAFGSQQGVGWDSTSGRLPSRNGLRNTVLLFSCSPSLLVSICLYFQLTLTHGNLLAGLVRLGSKPDQTDAVTMGPAAAVG